MGLNPADLVEKTLDDFIQEEKARATGPDKMDKESLIRIAELKLDRYEKRRHFKA